MWVAQLLFQTSIVQPMAQVAFRAEVAPVVLEVDSGLCASSVSVDVLGCHFGKDGSRLFDFRETLPGVFRSLPRSNFLGTIIMKFSCDIPRTDHIVMFNAADYADICLVRPWRFAITGSDSFVT